MVKKIALIGLLCSLVAQNYGSGKFIKGVKNFVKKITQKSSQLSDAQLTKRMKQAEKNVAKDMKKREKNLDKRLAQYATEHANRPQAKQLQTLTTQELRTKSLGSEPESPLAQNHNKTVEKHLNSSIKNKQQPNALENQTINDLNKMTKEQLEKELSELKSSIERGNYDNDSELQSTLFRRDAIKALLMKNNAQPSFNG